MIRIIVTLLFGTVYLFVVSCSQDDKALEISESDKDHNALSEIETVQGPNVLLIVVDDMGFNDLSIHGSEIQTPNIDMLMHEGLAFTNFHVAPTCSPTRAMLFSGTDNHIVGVGNMAGTGN